MEKIQEAFRPLRHFLKRTRKFEPIGAEIRIPQNTGTVQIFGLAGQTKDYTTLPKSSCRVHYRTEQEELNRHILVYNITAHYSDVYYCPVDVAVQVCGHNIMRAETRSQPPSQDGRISHIGYTVLFVPRVASKYHRTKSLFER